MEFLAEYGMFLLKAVTLVAAVLFLIVGILSSAGKGEGDSTGSIRIKHLNDRIDQLRQQIQDAIFSEDKLKKMGKERKKEEKDKKKNVSDEDEEKRVYVLDFDGDIKASQVDEFRREVTAVLAVARPSDEVVVRLETGGGMVHGYGLASSQLVRIKDKGIPLTICVDKVAASGGYMMACIADKIIAAPFAILGSIGVIAQVPNFHKILKKNDVDFEMLTAGEYKRTLTMFGENTDKAREKFQTELEDTHLLFKEFVSQYRPKLNIEEVATGETWFGIRAKEHNLIDSISTSDDYLVSLVDDAQVYELHYEAKKSLPEKLGLAMQVAFEKSALRIWQSVSQKPFM